MLPSICKKPWVIIVINMELNLSVLIRKVYLGKRNRRFVHERLFYFANRQIFCDFGDEFEVLDKDGENPITHIVTGISRVRRISSIGSSIDLIWGTIFRMSSVSCSWVLMLDMDSKKIPTCHFKMSKA